MAIITLLRKPFKGTVATNTLTYGCGGLNIDASRVAGNPWKWGTQTDLRGGGYGTKRPSDGHIINKNVQGGFNGRWAANLLVIEGSTLSRDKISRYFQHFRHEG